MWAVAFAVFALRTDTRRELQRVRPRQVVDPLTGVANLRAFEARADEVLRTQCADLRRDRRAADRPGRFQNREHAAWSCRRRHVLRSVAEGLQNAASKSHLVARIGGDEFAVLSRAPTSETSATLRSAIATRCSRCEKSFHSTGVNLDASIGSAITSRDGRSLEELMTAADRAMYVVKDRHTEASEDGRRAELATQLPEEFRVDGSRPPPGCRRRAPRRSAARVQPALE